MNRTNASSDHIPSGGGVNPFLVFGGIFAIFILMTTFGVVVHAARGASDAMDPGRYAACTIESVESRDGEYDRLFSSCGSVGISDAFTTQVTVGGTYDIEVYGVYGGTVGVTMPNS